MRRQHVTANNLNFLSLALPRTYSRIAVELVQFSYSASVVPRAA